METGPESAASSETLNDIVVPYHGPAEFHGQYFNASAACTIVYLSACRTTGCDVMCITSTSQRFVEGKTRRKGAHMKGLSAAIQYPSESSRLLGARTKVKMRTPADELTDDAVRERRNRELHKERHEFLKQMQAKQEMKSNLEMSSATVIQQHWRGYSTRLKLRAESTGALPRHRVSTRPADPAQRKNGDGSIASLVVPRIALTAAAIGEELRLLAHELGLKPIPGLSLPMSLKKTRQQKLKSTSAH